MFTTITEAFWYLVDLLRKDTKHRKATIIISVILFALAGIALALGSFNLVTQIPKEVFVNIAATLALLGIVSLTASLAASLPPEAIPPFLYRQEMRELRKERDEIIERNVEKKKTDLFDTVQLSLNEIREYCVLNKRQAWSSFAFGVFAIILGLLTLLFGVWQFYKGTSPNVTIPSLVSVSGLLVQFLGGTSLFLYRTTLQQGNFYFAHLVQMQDMMLAIKLCGESTDGVKKTALQEKIIDALLRRTSAIPPLPSHEESRSRG